MMQVEYVGVGDQQRQELIFPLNFFQITTVIAIIIKIATGTIIILKTSAFPFPSR